MISLSLIKMIGIRLLGRSRLVRYCWHLPSYRYGRIYLGLVCCLKIDKQDCSEANFLQAHPLSWIVFYVSQLSLVLWWEQVPFLFVSSWFIYAWINTCKCGETPFLWIRVASLISAIKCVSRERTNPFICITMDT